MPSSNIDALPAAALATLAHTLPADNAASGATLTEKVTLAQAAALFNLVGIVTPVGAVTPGFIGQTYRDTVLGFSYRASGLTNADWVAEPKIYRALLSQVAVADPTAAVLINTVGLITLARSNVGEYQVLLTPATYSMDKMSASVGSTDELAGAGIQALVVAGDTIGITTFDIPTVAAQDGILARTFFELLIYP
jgi:hypothetical protein